MDPAYNDVLPYAARSQARSKVASCIKVVDPVKLGRTPERLHTARPELTRSPARSIPHENYAAEAKAATRQARKVAVAAADSHSIACEQSRDRAVLRSSRVASARHDRQRQALQPHVLSRHPDAILPRGSFTPTPPPTDSVPSVTALREVDMRDRAARASYEQAYAALLAVQTPCVASAPDRPNSAPEATTPSLTQAPITPSAQSRAASASPRSPRFFSTTSSPPRCAIPRTGGLGGTGGLCRGWTHPAVQPDGTPLMPLPYFEQDPEEHLRAVSTERGSNLAHRCPSLLIATPLVHAPSAFAAPCAAAAACLHAPTYPCSSPRVFLVTAKLPGALTRSTISRPELLGASAADCFATPEHSLPDPEFLAAEVCRCLWRPCFHLYL